jgi:hypothetical protein
MKRVLVVLLLLFTSMFAFTQPASSTTHTQTSATVQQLQQRRAGIPEGHVCAQRMITDAGFDDMYCWSYSWRNLPSDDAYQNQQATMTTVINWIHNHGWVAVMNIYNHANLNASPGGILIFYRYEQCPTTNNNQGVAEMPFGSYPPAVYPTDYFDWNDQPDSAQFWAESNCHVVFWENVYFGGHHLDGPYRGLHRAWDLSNFTLSGSNSWAGDTSSVDVY